MITLRIMVVKGVLKDKDQKLMEKDPSYALTLLGCEQVPAGFCR